jgi:hypothetical protein
MSGTFVPKQFPSIALAAFSVYWEHPAVLDVVVRLRRSLRSSGQCSGGGSEDWSFRGGKGRPA